MGTNQHLIRSILAIREQGGVRVGADDWVMPDPILVGRNRAKLDGLAARFGLARVSTDLDAALARFNAVERRFGLTSEQVDDSAEDASC